MTERLGSGCIDCAGCAALELGRKPASHGVLAAGSWFDELEEVVLAAGFGAGMGLISMFALGVVFMTKSANVLPV